MRDDDSGVVTSRWLCCAAPDALGWATSEVGVFASAHGSCPAALVNMAAAVSEALVEVFDAQSASHAGTVVDAATDGVWLTVRLQGPGRWPADAVQARLSALADRVELSFDDGSESMTALFEFPSDAGDGRMPARGRAGIRAATGAHACGDRHRGAGRPRPAAGRPCHARRR